MNCSCIFLRGQQIFVPVVDSRCLPSFNFTFYSTLHRLAFPAEVWLS